MRNRHRQFIVSAVGMVLAGLGVSLRFFVLTRFPRSYLSLIGTWGKSSGQPSGTPAVEIPREIFSDVATALTYIGLALMFVPIVAWLFLPSEKIKDE